MKIKPVSSKVKAKRLKDLVLLILEEENEKVPPYRKITKHDALTVVERSLNETKGQEYSHRKYKAIRELSNFISLAHKNKTLLASAKNTDLLPIGHPRSTAVHYLDYIDFCVAEVKWITADFRISEEAKPLIASALSNPASSVEHKFAVARLSAFPQGTVPQEALVAALGRGNSFLARRARALLQRRDRYGRFAWMGGGVRALFRARRWSRRGQAITPSRGGVRSFTGRYVADSARRGFIQIENNLGEIFEVQSDKTEFVKAVLDSTPDGFSPSEAKYDSTDPITDFDSIQRVEAPNGWERTDPTNANSYTDGAFTVDVERRKLTGVDDLDESVKPKLSLKTNEGEELGEFDSWFETQNFLRGREVDIAGLEREPDGAEVKDSENQWEIPEGGYQIGRYVGYLPQGVEDGPEGATDDPRELANLFSKEELSASLTGALIPFTEGDEATGRAFLDFEGGLQDIPAKAVYQALKMQGEDADLEVARIYDAGLENRNNENRLLEERAQADLGEQADIADEITRPDVDQVEEPEAEIEDLDFDLPLIDGLTEEEKKEFRESGDYRNLLPTNETPDFPEDYVGLDPEPIDPTDTTLINITSLEDRRKAFVDFDEAYPIGFTNDPFYMAQRFDEDELRDAFVEAISPSSDPGYGSLSWLDDEGDQRTWIFQGETIRDALQLRGVDTNQLMRETYDEGRIGQEGVIPESEAERILQEVDTPESTNQQERDLRNSAAQSARKLFLGDEVEEAINSGAGREEIMKILDSQVNESGTGTRWGNHLYNLSVSHFVDFPQAFERENWRDTQSLKNYIESLPFEEIEKGDIGPEISKDEKKIARPAGVSPDDSRLENLNPEVSEIVEGIQIPDNRADIDEIDTRRQIANSIVEKETIVDQIKNQQSIETEGSAENLKQLNEKLIEKDRETDALFIKLQEYLNRRNSEFAKELDEEIVKNLKTNRAVDSNDPQEIRNVIEESEVQRRNLPVGEDSRGDPYIVSASGIDIEPGDVIVRDHFVITDVEVVERIPRGVRLSGSMNRTDRNQYIFRGYYPGHEEQIYPEALTANKQIRVIRNGNPPDPGERGRLNSPDPEDYLDGRADPDFKREYKLWRRSVLAAKRRYLPPQNLDEYAWVEDFRVRNGFWYNFTMYFSRDPRVNARVQKWARRLQLVENAARETSTNVVNAVDGTELGMLNVPRLVDLDNEENKPAQTNTTQNVNQDPKEIIAAPENIGNLEIEIPRTKEAWDVYAQAYWEEMVSDEPMPENFPEKLRINHGLPPFKPQDGAILNSYQVESQATDDDGQRWRWVNPSGTFVDFDNLDRSQEGEMSDGRIYNSTSNAFGYQTLNLEPRRAEVIQRIETLETPTIPEPTPSDSPVPQTQPISPEGNQPLILDDGEIASVITDVIPTPSAQRSQEDITSINVNGSRERVRSLLDETIRPAGGDPYRVWQEENFIYGDGVNQIALGDSVNHWGQSDGDLRGLGEGTVVGIEGVKNEGDRFRQAYAYVWYPNALQFDRNGRAITNPTTGEQARGTIKKHAVRMLFLNGRNSELERVFTEADNPLSFDQRAFARYKRLGRVRTFNPGEIRPLPQGLIPGQRITPIENLPPLTDGVPVGAPTSSPTPTNQTSPSIQNPDVLRNSIANRFLDRPAETRTPVGGVASFDGTTPGAVERNFNRVSPNKVTGDTSEIAYRAIGWSPETAARVSHAANNRNSAGYIRSLLNGLEDNFDNPDVRAQLKASIAEAYGADGNVNFGSGNFTLGIQSISVDSASRGVVSIRFDLFDSDGNTINGTNIRRTLSVGKNEDGTLNLTQHEDVLTIPKEYQNQKFGDSWKLYYDNWFIANGATFSDTQAYSNNVDFSGAYIWSGQGYGWSYLSRPGLGGDAINVLSKAKNAIDKIRAKRSKTDADLRAISDWEQVSLKASAAILEKNIVGRFRNEQEFLESNPTKDLNSAYIVGNSIYYRDEQTLGDGSFNLFTENDLFNFSGRELLNNISANNKDEEILKNFPTPRDVAFIGKDPYVGLGLPEKERKRDISWFGKDLLSRDIQWYAKKRYAPDDISLLQQQTERYELRRRESGFEQVNATFTNNEFTRSWFTNEENYSESLKPYADEINSMLNNPTSNGQYTVSLLSPPARRALQNELDSMLRNPDIRDTDENSTPGIIDMLNAINRDREFFENPLISDDDPVFNVFRQFNNSQIENFFNDDLSSAPQNVVINGEVVPNLTARLLVDGGINSTFEITDSESRKRYYLKREDVNGARSEFIVNRIAKNLEIVGLPNLNIVGEDERTGLSNWVISTNAGGNLNTLFLRDVDDIDPNLDAPGRFSARPGDMDGFNFNVISSESNINQIEAISVVNIAVLDALVDNTDRNTKNSLLLRNRPETTEQSNQKWQAVPIDNALTAFNYSTGFAPTLGDPRISSVEESLFRSNFSNSDYRDYISILGKGIGPVALKNLIDSRLEILRNNLREQVGGGWISQEELDFLNERIDRFEEISAENYSDFITNRTGERL